MNTRRVLALALVAIIALTAGCAKRQQPATGDNTPTPGQTDNGPTFDQAAGAYRLAPVNSPAGEGTAWAEVTQACEPGLSPFTVTYHAQRGNASVTTDAVYLAAEEVGAITWIDATTVLLGGRWVADLGGAGSLKALPDYSWSQQVSPDRTKIAFWGRTNPDDPSDTAMGPQLYDLATGTVKVIKTFTEEDWGFSGEIGILPLVAWADADTLLFDAPRPLTTSVFQYDLTSGRTDIWRDDGWHVLASGDGKYVAVAHTNTDGEYTTFVLDVATGTETELSGDKYGYPTSVIWRGDELAVFNSQAIGVGRMVDGRPVFAKESTGSAIIDVRLGASGVSYVELELASDSITGMKQVTLAAQAQ